MTTTMTAISTSTLGSSVSTLTFSSIPQTYTDLVLVCYWGTTITNGSVLNIQINGTNTASSYTRLLDSGGSISTTYIDGSENNLVVAYQNSENTFGSCTVNFLSYTNTNMHKHTLVHYESRNATRFPNFGLITNRSATTSPITSLVLFSAGGNLLSGSTFSLYGIKAK